MSGPSVVRAMVGNDGRASGVDVASPPQTINDRVELIDDREHQVRHWYFLGVTTLPRRVHAGGEPVQSTPESVRR